MMQGLPMPNYCPDCGTNVREFVATYCPSCGRRLPTGGGLIGRIVRWLLSRRHSAAPSLSTQSAWVIRRSQEFRIHDPASGEVKVYQSLAELPPEVRQRVEPLAGTSRPPVPQTTYTLRDSSGVERTYRSLEEMPAEIRALFEQGGVRGPSRHDEADS
jgi:hypothetical protein